MQQTRFELEIESKLENLPVITDFVGNVLDQFGADPANAYKVQLAIDEACTNIIKHAYSGEVGPIMLMMELIGDDLIINIGDKGTPFDPSIVPPPNLGADLDKKNVGGLGIYFMKKLMDQVSYSFNALAGNQLTMRKRLSLK